MARRLGEQYAVLQTPNITENENTMEVHSSVSNLWYRLNAENVRKYRVQARCPKLTLK